MCWHVQSGRHGMNVKGELVSDILLVVTVCVMSATWLFLLLRTYIPFILASNFAIPSVSAETLYCDPIHLDIKNFNGLLSHQISNQKLHDDITNLTHHAIAESAAKYGIASGSFVVEYSSAFGSLSILEVLCVVNKETLTVLSIIMQNEEEYIEQRIKHRLISLFGNGATDRDAVEVEITLILVSTTGSAVEPSAATAQSDTETANMTTEYVQRTNQSTVTEQIAADKSRGIHDHVLDHKPLLIAVITSICFCAASIGFACFMLKRSHGLKVYTEETQAMKAHNAMAINMGSNMERIQMSSSDDDEMSDGEEQNKEEAQEGRQLQHDENDDTAHMVDRFLKHSNSE